jgi:hypothetical protein
MITSNGKSNYEEPDENRKVADRVNRNTIHSQVIYRTQVRHHEGEKEGSESLLLDGLWRRIPIANPLEAQADHH